MPITIDFNSDQLAETAAVFALLSRLWASEVDAATLKSLRQKPLVRAWKQLGGSIPEDESPETIEALAIDYCQLVIGPKDHVPPIQSVWKQEKLAGDSSKSMQKYVEMVDGFKPCVDFVDHVAVQLQFASVLLGMADQAKRKLIRGLATAYARDHLEWTANFFQATESQAKTKFYRSLSKVSHKFLFA